MTDLSVNISVSNMVVVCTIRFILVHLSGHREGCDSGSPEGVESV